MVLTPIVSGYKFFFSLNDNHTFTELITELKDGDFRVGLHVQSIGDTGGSDSFIDTPPLQFPNQPLCSCLAQVWPGWRGWFAAEKKNSHFSEGTIIGAGP
jgi:hypothetical protein